MKKLILIASFIIGIGFMASAQVTKKTPEQRAAHQTKALQKQLSLSQDQATQVQAALFTAATRLDSLKNNPSSDKKANQLNAKSIKLEAKKQVIAVLNDSQKQKLATLEKMRKEKHKQKQAQRDAEQG
jgi:thiamine biosynthesis lipoprotein ApbE